MPAAVERVKSRYIPRGKKEKLNILAMAANVPDLSLGVGFFSVASYIQM